MSEILKGAWVEKQMVDAHELALMSEQALRPIQANEVFAFKIAACDDQIDRDLERFTSATLDQLAQMFPGRPVLRDHAWSASSQTARVYAGSTETTNGVKRLILRAYMPCNETTRPTVDAIELGILREASVGVSVRQCLCSVCGQDYSTCGHMRGETYEEKLCHVELDGAEDAYEVSLVAVPAQKEAGVVKRYAQKENRTEADGAEECSILRMAQAMQEMEEKRYGGMEV